MTEQEATKRAQEILGDKTATAFYDEDSPMYPYLVAIETPDGELGVIATGRNFADVLDKTTMWQQLQNKPAQL